MVEEQLNLAAGFRFHPTDEELVTHYLCKKCTYQEIAAPIIADLDLYKFDPWELPEMAVYGEKEWYFFSPRDRKYPNGSRPNRAAGTGYWKATGVDKPIGKPNALGIKKSLVFYAGKAPTGVKTNWIMHEYRLANVNRSASAAGKKSALRLDDWVLCRLYNKKGNMEKHFPPEEQRTSPAVKVQPWSPPAEDMKPNVIEMQKQFWQVGMPEFSSVPSQGEWSPPEVQSETKWGSNWSMNNGNGFGFDFDFDLWDFEAGLGGDELQDVFMYVPGTLF